MLLSMAFQGEDYTYTLQLFFRGSVIRPTATGCQMAALGAGFSVSLGLVSGLTAFEESKLGWGWTLRGLTTLLLGLTEDELLSMGSNILCLRCTLLVQCCWLLFFCGLTEEQFWSPVSTELFSDRSFLDILSATGWAWVTSIIFLLRFCTWGCGNYRCSSAYCGSLCWVSLLRCVCYLSCAQRWWIQSTYSFSLTSNSFIRPISFCSAAFTRASIRVSASLCSLLTLSISLRQAYSIFLMVAAQFYLTLVMPCSSYFLLSLVSSFFSKLSPSLSTSFLVYLTIICIFFSMTITSSREWSGEASLPAEQCLQPRVLSFFSSTGAPVWASRPLIFSLKY